MAKKEKIIIADVNQWKEELIQNTGIRMIHPTASEMIDSVHLPDIHKDPFDRLLIVQTNTHHAKIVTKDETIKKYQVNTLWI